MKHYAIVFITDTELKIMYDEYTYDMMKNIEPMISDDDIINLVESLCYSLSFNGVREGYYFLVDNYNKTIKTNFYINQ